MMKHQENEEAKANQQRRTEDEESGIRANSK